MKTLIDEIMEEEWEVKDFRVLTKDGKLIMTTYTDGTGTGHHKALARAAHVARLHNDSRKDRP